VALKETLRRAGPIILAGLALLFGGLSAGYAWIVSRHLRDDARETSRMLGRVFAGLNDPRPDAPAEALLELAQQVRSLGIPIVVTDETGRVIAMDNAPFDDPTDSAQVHAWIARLDAVNPPLVQVEVGTIHYGAPVGARRFQWLALLQGVVFVCLAGVTVWAFRWRLTAARDRLWVAMARESAHQLGTPLMSLTGWIDYVRENPSTPGTELLPHLEADADRLERVAKRFERIGRPARRESLALGALAERVVGYFTPRLPTLANRVRLELVASGPGPAALGDPVLVEWAIEALVKNAVDALSGRGGLIEVRVDAVAGMGRVAVVDDGPGVAPEIRTQLFEPGVSTKEGGWGIGLALARRIVEQHHRGRLVYTHGGVSGGGEARAGSTFVLELPLAPAK
jgi:signal transduction histidine kinase